MVELSVCIGTACHLKGSYNVIQAFQEMIEGNSLHDRIDFKSTFCTKKCRNKGIGVLLNGKVYNVQPEKAREFFQSTVMAML